MALVNGDTLLLTVFQSVMGEQVLNTFHYTLSDTPTYPASEYAKALWDHTKAAWRAAVPATTEYLFQRVLAESVIDLGDYGEYIIPVGENQGTRTGTTGGLLASFNAMGLKLAVGNRTTRPGSKRFAGATEGDAAGQLWEAPYLTLWNAVGPTLIDHVPVGLVGVDGMDPVVYGPIIEPHGDSPGRAVAVSNPVTGYQLNPYLSSQVSRKHAHGA